MLIVDVPAAIAAHRPDVVLMDIRMPKVDGLAATESVRRMPDPPAVLALTAFDLDEYVFRALQAGAAGFLLKDTPPAELIRAVRVIAAGEAILGPTATRTPIAQFASGAKDLRRQQAQARIAALTDGERQSSPRWPPAGRMPRSGGSCT